MVDFNSENVAGVNPKNLLLIIILQRSEYLADMWEDYFKLSPEDDNTHKLYIVRARLMTLYLRIRPGLLETMKPGDIKEFERLIASIKESELLEASKIVEDYLYKIGLTKIATRRIYDTTNAELENIEKGL
jgi:hypothetical protein